MPRHPLEVGFLAFTSYHEPGGAPLQAMRDSIALFQFAQERGIPGGWLRVRHFERGLTGAFPFLATVAAETDSIRIGTGVVPIAHENPIRLAEDAATVDILSGERLELGVSTGIAGFGAISEAFARAYGHDPEEDLSTRSRRVLAEFVHAIAHEELVETAPDFRLQFTDAGEGLRVYPHSPRLLERLWYGSGTAASTVRAAALGLNLQVSTINTEPVSSETVPREQAHFFDLYSEALEVAALARTVPDPRPRRVSISRYVVPYSTAEEKTRFVAASDRRVPRWPTLNGQGWNVGTVDEVVDQLLADEAIRRARQEFHTTLLLNLPTTLGLEWTKHLIQKVLDEVLPALERG